MKIAVALCMGPIMKLLWKPWKMYEITEQAKGFLNESYYIIGSLTAASRMGLTDLFGLIHV